MEVEDKETLETGGVVYKDTATMKLTRGMKGIYGWEIKVLHNNVEELIKVDQEMRVAFEE